ncbi:MAG TPA: hypothetical protein VKE93_02510 [Candidatus Angelobacter sp.]|nr:hypothetical protein [Candidatus Angelobacter sp.]
MSTPRQERTYLICTILLIIALLLVGCTASPLAYPHFWDYTKVKPRDVDLVGTYKFFKSSGSFGYGHGYQGNQSITITFHADHTAIISALPSIEPEEYKQVCTYSGPGVWNLDDHGDPDGWPWYVFIETKATADMPKKTFGPCSAWDMLVLSRRPPYRLYQTIGDPDNDTGLEFERVKP